MTSNSLRALLIAAAALATAVAFGGPAGAADPTPTFSGCGKAVKDSATDATDQVADPAPRETELEGAFVNADSAKPTLNLIVANLTGTAPPPATSVTYNAIYSGAAADTTSFVRAHIDFTGMVAYEYGHTEALAVSTRYAFDGPTEGNLFKGEHGVVQIVIPPEAGGKAGTTLKAMEGQTQLGRTTAVPGAVNQSPTRGLSYQDDAASIGTVTIGPCAPGAPAATTAPATATAPSTTPSTQTAAAGPLPVTLVSKKVKPAKAKKTVAIKLKASEPLTAVGLRISKGTKAYGTGKAAKLSGTKTIKVKVPKGLKKGSYVLDVAGTDAKSQRRIASFKLKVG